MAGLQSVPIGSGETRPFPNGSGQLQVVETDGGTVGLATFNPGWKWSENIKPVAGTDSCQVAHAGYVISGRMTLQMDDGESVDVGPGDVLIAPPGHDAWVNGDEPCVIVDWQGSVINYAKPS